VNDEEARAVLLRVIDLRDVREIPPRGFLSEKCFTAAAIDGAVAHDRAMGGVVSDDERFASMAALIHDSATAWRDVVVARIAGGVEHGVGIDEQSDARLEMERRSEKNTPIGGTMEFYRVARTALIDRLLNSFGVETAFVRV